jgi:hypothetical protein
MICGHGVLKVMLAVSPGVSNLTLFAPKPHRPLPTTKKNFAFFASSRLGGSIFGFGPGASTLKTPWVYGKTHALCEKHAIK